MAHENLFLRGEKIKNKMKVFRVPQQQQQQSNGRDDKRIFIDRLGKKF